MSSQSWTSWLLDSYASSVTPDTAEEGLHRTTSASSSSSQPTSASPSSMQLPYNKPGQGGAGNFTWPSESTTQDKDVVAQRIHRRQSSLSERQKAAALAEHFETNEALDKSKTVRSKKLEYPKLGVDGVDDFAVPPPAELQSPRSSSFSNSPVAGHGRGGAGNYANAADTEKNNVKAKNVEERRVAEKTREKVEAEVDEVLKMPEGALVKMGRERDES